MAHVSDSFLLALHGLRLKGFAEAPVVASLLSCSGQSISADDVTEELVKAAALELAILREGRMTGWALTPAGRVENERLLAEELDEVGARDLVQSAYDHFLALNGAMLTVCTAWQVKDADANQLNDHTDAEYDAGVIAELARVHGEVEPILNELLAVFDRFAFYPDRFSTALEKVQAGETEWFTKPIMESYHTVWFEMHEDLLATLGIDRASEGAH
jgi:hypothetical protein